MALRYDNWKVVFMEQRCEGTLRVWAEPFVALRVPKVFNLRTDPFERADITSNTYYDWFLHHDFIALAGECDRGALPGDVQAVSTAPKGGQLHHRPGDGEDGSLAYRRRTLIVCPDAAGDDFPGGVSVKCLCANRADTPARMLQLRFHRVRTGSLPPKPSPSPCQKACNTERAKARRPIPPVSTPGRRSR